MGRCLVRSEPSQPVWDSSYNRFWKKLSLVTGSRIIKTCSVMANISITVVCVCVCVCVYLWLQWCCHKYRSEEYIWRYLDDPLQDLLHLLSTKQAMGMKKEKNKKKMQIWRRWITRWGNSSRRGCWERRHRIVLLSTTSKDNPCPPPSIDLMHLSCITRLLLAIGPPGFTKGG
jgi:hypothetical protein